MRWNKQLVECTHIYLFGDDAHAGTRHRKNVLPDSSRYSHVLSCVFREFS